MDAFLAQKRLILDHVLYEMEMYLFTMDYIAPDQFLSNVVWVAHQTHMRNLLYFFSESKKYPTDIIYRDILNDVSGLGIDDFQKSSTLNVVNKSISHLTMERVTAELDTAARIEIERMKSILPEKVEKFIDQLQTNIKAEYANELNNRAIKAIIRAIQSRLAEIK